MSKRIRYTLTATSVAAILIEKLEGQDESVLETKTFNVADVPAELKDGDTVKSLAAYGLSKILQDRTSSSKNEDKLVEMDEVFALIQKGEWRVRKEGTGVKKAAIDPIFAQAIAEIKGCSVAAATMALQGKTTEERKALKSLDAVATKIKEIRENAEKEAATLLDDM